MAAEIRQAAELILNSKNLVAFAGAGLSEESGIPTFRGDEGIWKQYLPIIFGNPAGLFSAFVFSPGKFREFVVAAVGSFVSAEPNAGHLALAQLSGAGLLKSVITQNIDDLERRAGAKNVIQLHGNIYRMRCISCKDSWMIERAQMLRILAELKKTNSRADLIALGRKHLKCPNCHGWSRPDIVLFGESIGREDYYRAAEMARSCDLMLVLGTSGVVYPAAMIPNYGRKAGAKIIEVNPEATELSKHSDLIIRAGSAATLPAIIAEMKTLKPSAFEQSV